MHLEGDRLDREVAYRWLVLGVVAVLAATAHLLTSAWFSWHFVVNGSQLLYSPNGLQLYARRPDLQMGPLTFVLGGVFSVLLPVGIGRIGVVVLMIAVGLVAVRDAGRLAEPSSAVDRRRWLLAAGAATFVWSEVAVHYAHLDDAMALVLMLRALRLAKEDRPLGAALFVGLAADFKPWALPAAAVLLARPDRLRAALLVLGTVVVLVWLPFVVADPATLRILRFVIPVDRRSSLLVLGVTALNTPPWVRAAQLGGGLLLAGIAVRRRRWGAVLLLVIGLRMLLDPAAYAYYDSGLLLATAIFDSTLGRRTVPVATIIAFVAVDVAGYVLPSALAAVSRTAGLLALLVLAALAVAVPERRGSRAHPEARCGRTGPGRGDHLPVRRGRGAATPDRRELPRR